MNQFIQESWMRKEVADLLAQAERFSGDRQT